MLIGASGFSPNLAGSPRKPTSISSHPLTINVECFARDDVLLVAFHDRHCRSRSCFAGSWYFLHDHTAGLCLCARTTSRHAHHAKCNDACASSPICQAFKPNDSHGLNIAGKRLFRCWAMNPTPSSNALGLLQVERIEPQ